MKVLAVLAALVILSAALPACASAIPPEATLGQPSRRAAGSSVYAYVFADPRCPHCRSFVSWLEEKHPFPFYVCYISNSGCLSRFYELNRLIGSPGYVPTTALVNGTLRAVLIGDIEDAEFIGELFRHEGGIAVYMGYERLAVINASEDKLEYITKILQPPSNTPTTTPEPPRRATPSGGEGVSPGSLTVYAVVLGAVDSVDPCVFILYIVVLAGVSVAGGRRYALSALSFIAAVYASCIVLGFGLYKVPYIVPRAVFSTVALALAVSNALGVLGVGGRLVGKLFLGGRSARGAGRVFSILPGPAVWGAVLGFLSGFVTAPCSAGPYLLHVWIVSELPWWRALPYLMLYGAVFVMPLLVIALVGACFSRVEKARMFVAGHEKLIGFLSSGLLAGAAAAAALP